MHGVAPVLMATWVSPTLVVYAGAGLVALVALVRLMGQYRRRLLEEWVNREVERRAELREAAKHAAEEAARKEQQRHARPV